MKLPKKFDKMNNEEKRKWVAERLRLIRLEEEGLVKLMRLLVNDLTFVPRVDERPDLEYEKEN
jgi:hypothetical protein